MADTIEAIVLSSATEQERDAYLALADEYEACADSVPDGSALKSPEQDTQMFELAKRMEDALEAILRACPSHIRTLYEAVQEAIDAETRDRRRTFGVRIREPRMQRCQPHGEAWHRPAIERSPDLASASFRETAL
jgi:hypothetical protein